MCGCTWTGLVKSAHGTKSANGTKQARALQIANHARQTKRLPVRESCTTKDSRSSSSSPSCTSRSIAHLHDVFKRHLTIAGSGTRAYVSFTLLAEAADTANLSLKRTMPSLQAGACSPTISKASSRRSWPAWTCETQTACCIPLPLDNVAEVWPTAKVHGRRTEGHTASRKPLRNLGGTGSSLNSTVGTSWPI